MYNNKLINVDRKISVDVNDGNIDSVLQQVFAGTDIVYRIADKQIVLSRKQDAKSLFSESVQQGNIIKGTVVDAAAKASMNAKDVVRVLNRRVFQRNSDATRYLNG